MTYSETKEETLDPENWDEFRALGHKMLDDMINFQRDIAKRESLYPTPQDLEEICVPLSEKGEGEQKIFDIYQRRIKPYTSANRVLGPKNTLDFSHPLS
jgi:hypothetical protein